MFRENSRLVLISGANSYQEEDRDMKNRKLSRREFLRGAGLAGLGVGLVAAGCQPKTVLVETEKVVTQVVKETVIVEGESKVVEKVVEVTAAPPQIKGIELWTGFGQGRMAEAMAGAIERFNEDQGGKFEAMHIIIPWGEIRNKVLAATAAGNPPDVYRGWAWIVGEDAPLGGLTDLTPYVDATPDINLDDFWPATLEQMKYQGRFYGMSISTMVQLFYYNKDRMREVGVDPDNVPTDLEDWEMIGDKLYEITDDGKIDRIGFCPLIPGANVQGWAATRGAELWDASTGTCIANDDKNKPILVELFKWYKGYADRYGAEEIQAFITSYSSQGYGRNTPEGAYYNGRIGIWQLATWLYNDMKEYGPDVDFDVAKVPSPKGVSGKPCNLVANLYFVPAGCQNPAGGFAFANFMSSSPWVALNKAVPDSVTPSRRSNAMQPEVEAAAPWIKIARDDILPFAWPEPAMPKWSFYSGQLADALNTVIWEDADPGQALDAAVEAAQREVDKVLK
jgi:multiple sugar transport system substrate-binding protein